MRGSLTRMLFKMLFQAAAASLSVVVATAASAPLQCGVASAVFSTNPEAAETAVGTGKLSFWWNWNTVTGIDAAAINGTVGQHLQDAFVPMVWGTAFPSDLSWLHDKEGDVMGWNEPDQYGPACCNCDGKQSYYPATSSGWAPVFNPTSAVALWQKTVTEMTANGIPAGGGVRRVVSPGMAGDPDTQSGSDCSKDPSVGSNSHFCHGWLKQLKALALKLECKDFAGKITNCWDVIDVIQIHAYDRQAKNVHAKIAEYYKVFQEDFEGTNGRRVKTLWLTEVAMGSSKVTDVTGFVVDLMDPKTGLTNRAAGSVGGFGYVERVSWFSEFNFPAFNVSGYAPAANEAWVSTLFNPFGGLSPVGETFFSFCAPSAPEPPAPPAPPGPPPPPPPLPPPPSPPGPPSPPPPPGPKPGRPCPPATAAQCGADPCGKSAPYECLSGGSHGGCSADPSYWPNAPAACSACADLSKCK